jgi:hypothetical protein
MHEFFAISIAAAVVLAALCAAPLTFNMRAEKDFKVKISYLCFRRNYVNILKDTLRIFNGNYAAILKFCAVFLRRPARIRRFRLKIAVSAADAAETAVVYGLLRIFSQILYTRFQSCKPEITLVPLFTSRFTLSLNCDISLSLPVIVFLLRRPQSRTWRIKGQ